MLSRKRHAAVGLFALFFGCSSHCSPTESSPLFAREVKPHQGTYHHVAGEGRPAAKMNEEGTGHYLFFHKTVARTDNGSSSSSSSSGPTDTTSDTDPSSTNDSSVKVSSQDDVAADNGSSSASSSTAGKTDTTSDTHPSSTNDSSVKVSSQDDVAGGSVSSGSSSSGPTDQTSDSKPSSTNDSSFINKQNNTDQSSRSSTSPGGDNETSDSSASSTNDSSMNSKGQGNEEQSEDTSDDNGNDTTTKSDPCKVANNGNFGTTSSGGRGLQFFFQMETVPTVDEALVNDVLLPLLETGIAGQLLSLLFSECRESKRRLLRRTLQGSDTTTCEAKGFSNLPVDRVLSDVPCVGVEEDSENNCFVVDAGARLYFDAGECADAADVSKSAIEKAMDSGIFNSIDRRILNVTYVDEEDLELSATDKTVQSSGGSGDSSEVLPGWAWGIIGAGAFIFVALCAYVCCKRHPKHEDEMSAPLSEGDVDYEPPASDHENPYYDNSHDPQSVESGSVARTDEMLPPMEETSGEDTD